MTTNLLNTNFILKDDLAETLINATGMNYTFQNKTSTLSPAGVAFNSIVQTSQFTNQGISSQGPIDFTTNSITFNGGATANAIVTIGNSGRASLQPVTNVVANNVWTGVNTFTSSIITNSVLGPTGLAIGTSGQSTSLFGEIVILSRLFNNVFFETSIQTWGNSYITSNGPNDYISLHSNRYLKASGATIANTTSIAPNATFLFSIASLPTSVVTITIRIVGSTPYSFIGGFYQIGNTGYYLLLNDGNITIPVNTLQFHLFYI